MAAQTACASPTSATCPAQPVNGGDRPPPARASVRGVSVRRGSKAVANDGTKLRGVDIRMAAAFALKEIVTDTRRGAAQGEGKG